MRGPVVQWQLITKDPERSARFYQQMFDWAIDADNALGYRIAKTGDGGMDGGFWPAPPTTPSFVQLFVEVDDVAQAVERATGFGGGIIVPPQMLPNGDQLAILRDPEGVSFGVMQRRAGR